MRKIIKAIAVMTGMLVGFAQTSTAVSAKEICYVGGYVKSVAQNLPQFHDNAVIGIGVLHDDGQMRYYYSYQFMDAGNNPEMRSLLQLATAAYLSQAHVWVSVEQSCNYRYLESDGRIWVTRWNGLWMEGN